MKYFRRAIIATYLENVQKAQDVSTGTSDSTWAKLKSLPLPCISFGGYIWSPKLKARLHRHAFSQPAGPPGLTSKKLIPILSHPFSGHCPASGHHPLLTRLCQLLLVISCYLVPPHKFVPQMPSRPLSEKRIHFPV